MRDCKSLEEIIVDEKYIEPCYLFFSPQDLKKVLEEIGKKCNEYDIYTILGIDGPGLAFATPLRDFLGEDVQLGEIKTRPMVFIRPEIDPKENVAVLDDYILTGFTLRRVKEYLNLNKKYSKKNIFYFPIIRLYDSKNGIGEDELTRNLIKNNYYCEIDVAKVQRKRRKIEISKEVEINNLEVEEGTKSKDEIKKLITSRGMVETWNAFKYKDDLKSMNHLIVEELKKEIGEEKINSVIGVSPWSIPFAVEIAYSNDLPLIIAKRNFPETKINYRPRGIKEKTEKLRPLIFDSVVYTGSAVEGIVDDFKLKEYVVCSIVRRKNNIGGKEVVGLFDLTDDREMK